MFKLALLATAVVAASVVLGAPHGVLVTAATDTAARPTSARAAAQIGPDELRRYPPIVFLWGEADRVTHTAAADLYVARLGQTSARRLRAWPSALKDRRVYGAARAAWSPDGKQIGLLLSWWCGDPCRQLARVPSDGGRLSKLVVRADIADTDWSRDWNALLTTFSSDELWTVPMKGGKAVRIWRSPGAGVGGVDWSPNGRHLVVATRRGFRKMTRAGRSLVVLMRGQSDVAPAWSPDGRTVGFIRQPACYWEPECDDPSHVFVVGSDGRGLRRVTSTVDAISVLWSPDSRSILVTSSSRSDAEVFDINIVGADGKGLRVLASGRYADAFDWSRDGTKILFVREASRERGSGAELWVMDADGSRQTPLPFYRPHWSILSADWRPS